VLHCFVFNEEEYNTDASQALASNRAKQHLTLKHIHCSLNFGLVSTIPLAFFHCRFTVPIG